MPRLLLGYHHPPDLRRCSDIDANRTRPEDRGGMIRLILAAEGHAGDGRNCGGDDPLQLARDHYRGGVPRLLLADYQRADLWWRGDVWSLNPYPEYRERMEWVLLVDGHPVCDWWPDVWPLDAGPEGRAWVSWILLIDGHPIRDWRADVRPLDTGPEYTARLSRLLLVDEERSRQRLRQRRIGRRDTRPETCVSSRPRIFS